MDNLNHQWGSRTKPSPQRTTHSQSTGTASEPVKFERGPKYHNPDPVTQLIGCHNEAWVEVNGVSTHTLIDRGGQMTTMAHGFIRQLQLEVHNLNEVIWVEGTGDFTVPYSVYLEVNLWIPQFP